MSTQRPTSAVAVAEPPAVTERTFAHHGAPASDLVAWFTDGLARVMSAAGYEARAEPGPDVQVLLHVVDSRGHARIDARAPQRSSSRSLRLTSRPRTCCAPAIPSSCAASPTSRCW